MPPILVLGEALVDRLPGGSVAGGAPFNVARSLAALGVPVHLISRVGGPNTNGSEAVDGEVVETVDADGALVMASARHFGLSEAGLQRDALHATGAVTVHSLQGEGGIAAGHRFEIHADAAWDYLDAQHAFQNLPAERASVVYFGTLAQRSAQSRQSIRAVLESTAALRYLDLNLREPFGTRELVAESLARADWLKVNDDELALLLDWFAPTVPGLMQQFSLQRLILTRGADGWVTYNTLGVCELSGPSSPVAKLADTVGAGDAFSAMLLAAHSYGMALGTALPLAAGYAARMCEQHGPMAHDPEFFEPWLRALRRPL